MQQPTWKTPPQLHDQPKDESKTKKIHHQRQQGRSRDRQLVKVTVLVGQQIEPHLYKTKVCKRQGHQSVLDLVLDWVRQRNGSIGIIVRRGGLTRPVQIVPPFRFRQYIRRRVPGNGSERTISKCAAPARSNAAAFSAACRESRPRVRRRNISSC